MFHYFPETVQNLEKLCNSANISFTVPENQTCCGLPYFEKGEMKPAKTIAEYNLKTFGEGKVICASMKCEDTIAIKYPKIFNNTISHNHSVKLASSAMGLDQIFQKLELKHASAVRTKFFFIPDCTTDKGKQNAWLQKFSNAEFHFTKLENTCCGAGFCLPALHPLEAEKMTQALIQQATECGADTILTSNEICLQQINNIIRKYNHPLKGMHLIDLFASAI